MSEERKVSKQPNILIFCTDEQRGDHLGCMGHPDLKTPNIDRIAAEGTLFRSCYSSSPICMPARATMFTGQTNRVTGVVDNGIDLRQDIPTMPGMLADAGYRTHCVGKLHLQNWGGAMAEGETPESNPERRIYWDWPGRREGTLYKHFPDNYYGLQTIDLANGHVNYIYGDYVTWLEEKSPGAYAGYKCNNADPHPLAIESELHYNTWIADRSIGFIRDHVGPDTRHPTPDTSPFFLWCSFPDPHEPFAAVKEWSEFYDDVEIKLPQNTLELSPDSRSRTMTEAGLGTDVIEPELVKKSIRQTYGMISHLDEQVGRVLDCLDELGIADDTVVMFISDHGDQLGEHGLFFKSVYPYEAHMHIPFVVKAPGGPRGKVVDDVVSMLDLVPTTLSLAGVAPVEELPGEILTPVVAGDALPVRKNALVEVDRLGRHGAVLPMRTMVTNDHKLVYYPGSGETMLFDRKNDPLELQNIADAPECQPVVSDLLKRLLSELARTEMPARRRRVEA